MEVAIISSSVALIAKPQHASEIQPFHRTPGIRYERRSFDQQGDIHMPSPIRMQGHSFKSQTQSTQTGCSSPTSALVTRAGGGSGRQSPIQLRQVVSAQERKFQRASLDRLPSLGQKTIPLSIKQAINAKTGGSVAKESSSKEYPGGSNNLEEPGLPKLSRSTPTAPPKPIERRTYRYRFIPGNNGRVILQALRRRPWWHATGHDKQVDGEAGASLEYDFLWEMYRSAKRYRDKTYKECLLNHLQANTCLVTKKGLYFTLRDYCASKNIDLLSIVPRTFFLPSCGSSGPAVEGKTDDTEAFMKYNTAALAAAKATADAEAALENPHRPSTITATQVPPAPLAPPPAEATDDATDSEQKPLAASASATESSASPILSSNASAKIDSKEELAVDPSPPDAIASASAGTVSASSGTISVGIAEPAPQGIVWICKPASLTNRGFGIQVIRGTEEVLQLTQKVASAQGLEGCGLEQCKAEGTKPSSGMLNKAARRRAAQEGWIVQEYMERPLLVSGRKFDIRCFVLLTLTCEGKNRKGNLRAFYFREAYVRTSCKKYSLGNLADRECHLTNDAVQKHAKAYGKYESGNKLTLEEWQATIDKDYPSAPPNVVMAKVEPEIRRLCALSVSAAASKLSVSDIDKSFELLGCKYTC